MPPVFNKILKNGIIVMNRQKIKNLLNRLPIKLDAFIKITLFLSFFGTVCYLVAGWRLLRAIPAGIITAFVFMVIGECVLKILILVSLLYQRWKENNSI